MEFADWRQKMHLPVGVVESGTVPKRDLTNRHILLAFVLATQMSVGRLAGFPAVPVIKCQQRL